VFLTTESVSAASVDFEDIAPGTEFSSPFSIGDISFGSPYTLLVTNIGTSNAICSSLNGSCIGTLDMAIAGGARDLSFTFSGDTDPTTQYIMDVEASVLFNGQLIDLQFLAIAFADGNALNEQLVHFDNPRVTINSLNIHSLDDSAFVVDNIHYLSSASAVPEPAPGALAALGLTALALKLRRRLATATAS
jgi:hypothetical protein